MLVSRTDVHHHINHFPISYYFEEDHGILSDLTSEQKEIDREREQKEREKSLFVRVIDEFKKVFH